MLNIINNFKTGITTVSLMPNIEMPKTNYHVGIFSLCDRALVIFID